MHETHAPAAKESGLGLSSAEAASRLASYGPNELPKKQRNPLLQFLAYFWGPIPWMIEAAAVLALVVHDVADFAIILALLLANAVVGFWEEHQAGNAIAALETRLAPEAIVRRDGAWRTLPARELVPGDLIRLRLGDIVPADATLRPGDALEVDQSALTGESLPATRQPGETVYSGSIVSQGDSEALVSTTGAKTFFGKTAQLVESAHAVSHFQRAVLKIGDYLIVIAIALVVVILTVALFRGEQMLTTLEFALVLTVAAIPVAMPTVLSVTMAVGARLLARDNAVVSRLAAVEELAGLDVLCSDKTGTLTQNALTLGEPSVIDGADAEDVIIAAALASRDAEHDPIDRAVLSGVAEGKLASYAVEHFTPFDPVHKRTEAAVRAADGHALRRTKGAPQVILALVGEHERERVAPLVERAVADFAGRGFRALGVAGAEGDGPWRYLGVLPLFDPPRDDSKQTIESAREMGVDVKMVTGDQVAIARETARRLGLGSNIVEAGALELAPGAGSLAAMVERTDGFAQVFPEHKFRIVEALQANNAHLVGMTGDGVNDAPALKLADAGIAVSGATDAARAAADIVLLTPGLSVIVDAIKESRRIFRRMTSYAIYRISETIRVLLFMTLSILVFNFYPVSALMIVLLALLNDGAILTIAYDRAHYSESPTRWDMHTVLGVATALGLTGVVASFGLFYLAERVFHLDRPTIQTLIYLKLSFAGQTMIFATRTRGAFFRSRPAPILLVAVASTQLVATLISVYGVLVPPIGWHRALSVWAYAAVWFLIADRVKVAAYRIFSHRRLALGARRAP